MSHTQPTTECFASVLKCIHARCKLCRYYKTLTNQRDCNCDVDMLEWTEVEHSCRVCLHKFFQLSGQVSNHNVRIRGYEQVSVWSCTSRTLEKTDCKWVYGCPGRTSCYLNCKNCNWTLCSRKTRHLHIGLFPLRNQLDSHFSRCWVGWDMPFTMALHSPELTPLELFLQGYVKDMYSSHVASLDLRSWQMPFSAVTSDVLECIWIEIDWLLIIWAAVGVHLEIMLKKKLL